MAMPKGRGQGDAGRCPRPIRSAACTKHAAGRRLHPHHPPPPATTSLAPPPPKRPQVLRLRATDPLPNKYARAQAAKHEADVAASRAVADLQRASAALERGTQELGVRVKQEQQVKAHAKAGASFEHKSDESSGSGSGSGSTDGVANPGSGAAAPSAATSAAAVVAGGAAAGVSAAAALPEAGAPQVDVADRRIKRGSTPAAAAAAAAAATAAAVPVPEVEMELAGIQADLEKGG